MAFIEIIVYQEIFAIEAPHRCGLFAFSAYFVTYYIIGR